MARKFNTKTFQGKNRVYSPVSGASGILKLWVWDETASEYRTPLEGKIYDARRYELGNSGDKTRVKRYFSTLEEARAWQNHFDEKVNTSPAPIIAAPVKVELVVEPPKQPEVKPEAAPAAVDKGPSFGEIYEAFRRKKVSVLSKGTQINYARYLRIYFQDVLAKPIRDITPQFIDLWIDSLRETVGTFHQSRQRANFDHELSVMRTVLRFYADYYDDNAFHFPLKARHAEDVQIGKTQPKLKDLQEDEFIAFRKALATLKHGEIMAPMATVQFYEALRISEVAGLFFEDLNLNFRAPQDSTIRVCRHIFYPRDGKSQIEILPGFKNAGGGDLSVKELYLFPEAFAALKEVFRLGVQGLVFGHNPKTPFTYRQIQKAYDESFKKAGLSYRGTHVLRHGGCRRVYNATGGDLALAQQLLGNSDLESTLVYAQRDKGALKKHVQKLWVENPNPSSLVAIGRNQA